MGVETLGEAWSWSWTIYVRCLDDGQEGLKHRQECGYRKYLDLETLVCTRGRAFPIARIAERLKCPRCGTFPMGVMFEPPRQPVRNAAAARNPRDALYGMDHGD